MCETAQTAQGAAINFQNDARRGHRVSGNSLVRDIECLWVRQLIVRPGRSASKL
jgi:hypothetical protein